MIDFSLNPTVKNQTHWHNEINQFYHPTGKFEPDSFEIVYAGDVLNTTKFGPILLKEWFYLVKQNGYLIIDYKPNEICDWQKLEQFMWWLWKGQYNILYHSAITESEREDLDKEKLSSFLNMLNNYYSANLDAKTLLPKEMPVETKPLAKDGYVRFVCQKKTSTTFEDDSIEKWSFGIITDGSRADWIEGIIDSIRKQNIPKYEIIICGKYFDRQESDISYIPFNERDSYKGWITKKKNLIADNAKYENLVIIHDRMYFDDMWYEGMLKWGNCFEVLGVPQLFCETGERFGDWIQVENPLPERVFDLTLIGGNMEYRDWDKDIPSYGAGTMVKRSLLQQTKFPEDFYWGQPESFPIHNEMTTLGYIIRFNPLAITLSKTRSVVTTSWQYEYNPKKLGRLRGLNPLVLICLHLLHKVGFRKNHPIFNPVRSFLRRKQGIKTHKDFG